MPSSLLYLEVATQTEGSHITRVITLGLLGHLFKVTKSGWLVSEICLMNSKRQTLIVWRIGMG